MRTNQEEYESRTHISEAFPKLRYDGPHKKGVDVAEYHGFRLLQPMRVKKDDRVSIGALECPCDRVALLRTYLQRGMDTWEQPVQVAHTYKVPYKQDILLKLEALGTKRSVVEAMLIHAAHTILKEHNISETHVRLNTLGDRDSIERFVREVSNYYRKRINLLDPESRQAFKKDPTAPLKSHTPECVELKKDAPKSLNFLTEPSRRHFAEILEYLESLDIPYHLDEDLIGNHHYGSRSIFEIRSNDDTERLPEDALAFGERYDQLAKKAGLGRRVPGAGITIKINANQAHSNERFVAYKTKANEIPSVYFIQLGLDAKRRALQVAEELRQAGISVNTALAEESLTRQLNHAKKHKAPILVILGQKEINDNTILIRNLETSAQRAIPRKQLVPHLRRVCR